MSVQPWDFFISYSHRDVAYAKRLQRGLSSRGLKIWWDERLTVGKPFGMEIDKALALSRRVLVLWSKNGVKSEWVQQEASAARHYQKILPYRLDDCALPVEFMNLHTKPLGNAADAVDIILNDSGAQLVPGSRALTIRDPEIYLAKLPQTAAQRLFGREREFSMLFEAWDSGKTGVVILQAMGGQGKTALMRHWVQSMMECGWSGASRVYVESFYSQGTDEKRGGSADAFFTHALKWFGYDGPKITSRSAEGEELARRVQQERTLLILDGLEPLQYPAHRAGMAGKLKDPGLTALILQLAHQSRCMCLITTRFGLPELKALRPPTVVAEPLPPISDEAGASLLQDLGVRGTVSELKAAVHDLNGHALAVSLLGRYLIDFADGHIAQRSKLPLMPEHAGDRSLRRVMRRYEIAYEERIREQSENGKKADASASAKQLELLRLMGLFDRPADRQAILAIFAKPAIQGVTDAGVGMSDGDLKFAITQLRGHGLLFPAAPGQQEQLDAHPLIREYFADRLQNLNNGRAEAHGRLYSYFLQRARATTLANTIESLEPYFAAIAHGCGAGLYSESLDLFVEHISRGSERFASKSLGAHGSILGALVHFFVEPWKALVSKVDVVSQVRIASSAGFALRSLGRLPEAAEAFQTAATLEGKIPGSKRHYISLRHLSDTWLSLGEVQKAIDAGTEAVRQCNGPSDGFQRSICLVILARALHFSGNKEKALNSYLEAERLVVTEHSSRQILTGWQGYFLADLLLEMGRDDEARRRSEQALKLNASLAKRLDTALDHLAAGLVAAQSGKHGEANQYIELAVHGIGDAGEMFHLPVGLLARAGLLRTQGRFDDARKVLIQVQEICATSRLELMQIDHDIEAARLDIAELGAPPRKQFLGGGKSSAWLGQRAFLATKLDGIRSAVDQTRYLRRAPAITQLETQLANLEKRPQK
ncbi:MAG: hypothetical protein DCF16_14760 [Alphaproteobacteria bacterium]|nr:MAG: hypothetical protein DCF16_14760 [Alphaproteobacteria bacterium]